MTNQTNRANGTNIYLIPATIVFSAVLLTGALVFSGSGGSDGGGNAAAGDMAMAEHGQEQADTSAVRPVDDSDHIRGDIDAPVTIVEYSDFDCPFCQRFHGTMAQVMEQYGESGEVAWVMRHFPVDQSHPNASMVAHASECAAELGGDAAFWEFADSYFAAAPVADADAAVTEIADTIGLDGGAFAECMDSDRHAAGVTDDLENAVETGGRGTPWSIVIGPDGQTFPINGAQPMAALEQVIEAAKR